MGIAQVFDKWFKSFRALGFLTQIFLVGFSLTVITSSTFVFVMSDHKWMTGIDDKQKETTETFAKVAAGASFLPAFIVIGICLYAAACFFGLAKTYCDGAEGAENTPLVQPAAAAAYQQQPPVMQPIAGMQSNAYV